MLEVESGIHGVLDAGNYGSQKTRNMVLEAECGMQEMDSGCWSGSRFLFGSHSGFGVSDIVAGCEK